MSDHQLQALATGDLYPAVLRMLTGATSGSNSAGQSPGSLRVLDVPAGQGAFAQELLRLGYQDIDCLDINAEAFRLKDPRVRFRAHDVIDPLPFPDAHFDIAFSIEGIEHFRNPWTFVEELCRVLKPGGRLYLSTPNTFSIDARLKYLMSGYFPRFRPLMLQPDKVMSQPIDDAHISPVYFWQLNFFLLQGGVSISRVATNSELRKPRWIKRVMENMLAGVVRSNIRRRRFPDHGVTSDAVLFGDCIIVEGIKAA